MDLSPQNLKSSKPQNTEELKGRYFPIIGIGASAGGLDAMERFFKNMPIDTGMAFVVIQHLEPLHKHLLPELLQRITKMNVIHAVNQLKVQPNCVYVNPPKKSVTLINGRLHLFAPVEKGGLQLPIDIFFSSIADEHKENSVGVILSGMGSDGSEGVKAIKDKGGLVLVQSPDEAKFNNMPLNASEVVKPDIIALAEELPAKLIATLKNKEQKSINGDNQTAELKSLQKVIALLKEQTGHDFSAYKKNTLIRRIDRRKGIHQIEKTYHYARFLQTNPHEILILYKELLIGVTNFFRDEKLWVKLKHDVIPDMLKQAPDGTVLRAWVPACSTGEEAYSLAIIFKEAVTQHCNDKNVSLQIFATDLDEDAIDVARKGAFPLSIKHDVSPDRINKFFVKETDSFRVLKPIREMIIFAPQNIIKDPPFTKLNILSCRNMLIYMEAPLQKKLMSLFNYSLNIGGIMVLGTSETIGTKHDGFEEIDRKLKIFKRTQNNFYPTINHFPNSFYPRKQTITMNQKQPIKNFDNIQSLAEQIIIQHYAPASVLVNNNGDVLYITGRTGKYLEPPAGKANWNILALAREGLRQQLLGIFRKMSEDKSPIIINNLKVGSDKESVVIDLSVIHLESPEPLRGLMLIIFQESAKIEENKAIPITKRLASRRKLEQLETDLKNSLNDLQNAREEKETSQEELKSINEELQSTNEELQSTNEELTTSREELQSLNEELQTVNNELQSKISDLERSSDDMKNLLNSTEIATLFLDKELNIRRYTEQATKIFKVRPSDVGRPFTDLVTSLNYPDIDLQAQAVLKNLISTEKAVAANDKGWFNVRIMPYRTLDDRIDGLVMTFMDISFAKNLEIQLEQANEALLKAKMKKE